MANQIVRNLLAVVGILVLILIAYAFMTAPDQRTVPEKVNDAVNTLPQGIDKAGRQLEDRTPGQKLGDAIKDNTQER